jgi:hypothetical protein
MWLDVPIPILMDPDVPVCPPSHLRYKEDEISRRGPLMRRWLPSLLLGLALCWAVASIPPRYREAYHVSQMYFPHTMRLSALRPPLLWMGTCVVFIVASPRSAAHTHCTNVFSFAFVNHFLARHARGSPTLYY